MEAKTTHSREAAPPGENGSARCPNCDAAARGRYCPACGQEQRVPLQPLGAMLRDGLGTFFSLDFRVVATLRRLLFAPGRLTEAYVQGQRARFTKPFRLYLAASAVYFLATQLLLPDFFGVFFGGAIRVQGEAAAIYQKWLPRALFVLVTAIELLVKLAHRRLRRLYAEHLIFSLHYFSFYFALSLCIALFRAAVRALGGVETGWLSTGLGVLVLLLATVAPVAYLAVSIRRVYDQTVAWSVAKAVALLAGQFALLVVVAIVIDEAGLA